MANTSINVVVEKNFFAEDEALFGRLLIICSCSTLLGCK